MEILKRGVPGRDTLWKGKCRSCGSEARTFQFELNNINPGTQRDGGPWSWEVCPVCNAGRATDGYGGMIFYKEADASNYL